MKVGLLKKLLEPRGHVMLRNMYIDLTFTP